MMVTLTIDRQMVRVENETPIIDAARRLGIHIPTLCHHRAIRPYGACRLCVVEVIKGGWPRLVTSCNYPAQQGIQVFTSSDRVKTTRKMLLELLLSRCPDSPVIKELAANHGVRTSRFRMKSDESCILCGLCVRACDELVGVRAIGFANRGTDREVGTPFQLESDVCIGCGACTYICPTTCVEMKGKPSHDAGGQCLHMGNLAMEPCPYNYECGNCEANHQFVERMRQVVERVRI
jgi:NADH dehydrogenase/NADH:ubiquinone oxidoreductase subunit G